MAACPICGAAVNYQSPLDPDAIRGNTDADPDWDRDISPSDQKLVPLIEAATGPLHRRANGELEGPCPWHSSRSGRCLSVYAGGTRWYCRSCGRGGDAVRWVILVDGLSWRAARQKLGIVRSTQSELPIGEPVLRVHGEVR